MQPSVCFYSNFTKKHELFFYKFSVEAILISFTCLVKINLMIHIPFHQIEYLVNILYIIYQTS